MTQDTKSFLFKHFDVKDFGSVDVNLVIKLIRNKISVALMQSHYVEKLLKRLHYDDVKFVPTLVEPYVKLRSSAGESIPQLKYS